MNPMVSLHPALLMASGYECINSRDARLLHAYRQYFYEQQPNGNDTHVVSPADFAPGGICNPTNLFASENSAYMSCMGNIKNFPYLTFAELKAAFYYEPINKIQYKVLNELYDEIEAYLLAHKLPYSFLQPTTEVITKINQSILYQKIVALHLCGMGEKLRDTFDMVFRQFKKLRVSHDS